MADTTLKRWNSDNSQWEELNPQTTHTQIVASGTPSSSTYLRGDGTWATVQAGTTFDGGTVTGDIEISNTLPKLKLTDTNNNSDFQIVNNNGTLELSDTTNQVSRVQITSNGDVILPATGGLSLVDKAITNSSGALLFDGDEIYHEGHKPTLTELGAAASSHTHTIANVTGLQTALDGKAASSHTHSIANVTGLQTALDSKATPSDISTAVSNLVDSSPATLNTLNELAAALGDDPNFATTVSNSIGTKVSSSLLSVAAGANTVAQRDASGNLTTAGQLNFANNDGFVYNDTTNIMYVKKDGTDRAIITDDTIGSQSVNYATSSGSTTGNAATATKLATARNIALSGDVIGNANFDGSGNISISTSVGNDSHTHSQVYIPDTRGASRAPNYYPDNNVSFDFQSSGDTGAGGDGWNVLQTVVPWDTYNASHRQQQIAFTGSGGMKFRYATSETAWAGWQRLFADDYHPNADTLTTARTINGTSFNGSANITTSNWGTARTLTVGNTGKSVNGSGNVSWSLAEIGAYAASNPSGYTTYTANQAVNTSSNVTFNEVYSNSWLRNNNANTGLYNQATGMHWYSTANNQFSIYSGQASSNIRFMTSGGTVRGYVHADDGNNIGFLDENGTWALRVDNSVNTILTGGLVIEGSINSGGYEEASQHEAAGNNIILKGDSIGRSGIFFQSEKNGTNINHSSDFGYIQFFAYGVGGTSGESNELVIGVSNDQDDHLILNAPNNGIKHRNGVTGTDYTVWSGFNFDPNSKLNTSGGTISGSITVTGTGSFNNLEIQGNTVWSESNLSFSLSGTTLTITTS